MARQRKRRVPVAFAPRVDAWVEGETECLALYSKPAARRFVAMMREAKRFLSEYPLGAPVNEEPAAVAMAPGSHLLVRGEYLISYRLTYGEDGVIRAVEIFAIRSGYQGDARRPEP
jgi:hypothetical protein